MRLTMIGCGTAIPHPGRRPTSLWLDVRPDVQIRIDCGPGAVHSTPAHGLDWQAQTHQLVTHFHLDHVGDLPLLFFAFKYGRQAPDPERGPLPFYGPAGLEDLLRGMDELLHQGLLDVPFPTPIHVVEPDSETQLADGVTLKATKTIHTAESLAMRIEADGKAFGFTGDTGPADHLAGFFEGVDLLVAECSYVEPDPIPHLAIPEVAALAAESGAKHLVLSHLYFDPDEVKPLDRLAGLFDGPCTIGYDGLRMDV